MHEGKFCIDYFWQKQESDLESYAPITLTSEDGSRFCEPVRVPGVPGPLERAHVLLKIKGKTQTLLHNTSRMRKHIAEENEGRCSAVYSTAQPFHFYCEAAIVELITALCSKVWRQLQWDTWIKSYWHSLQFVPNIKPQKHLSGDVLLYGITYCLHLTLWLWSLVSCLSQLYGDSGRVLITCIKFKWTIRCYQLHLIIYAFV